MYMYLECQHEMLARVMHLISARLSFVGIMFFEVSKNKALQKLPPITPNTILT